MNHIPRVHVSKETGEMLLAGHKTTLLQIDDRIFARLEDGKPVKIYPKGGRVINMMITVIRRYKTLEEALNGEDLETLGHGDREQAHAFLSRIYEDELHPHNIYVVLKLEPIQK